MPSPELKDKKALLPLKIDLSDIKVEDMELFFQEGARALPDMAASCQCNTGACCSSCGPAGGVGSLKP